MSKSATHPASAPAPAPTSANGAAVTVAPSAAAPAHHESFGEDLLAKIKKFGTEAESVILQLVDLMKVPAEDVAKIALQAGEQAAASAIEKDTHNSAVGDLVAADVSGMIGAAGNAAISTVDTVVTHATAGVAVNSTVATVVAAGIVVASTAAEGSHSGLAQNIGNALAAVPASAPVGAAPVHAVDTPVVGSVEGGVDSSDA